MHMSQPRESSVEFVNAISDCLHTRILDSKVRPPSFEIPKKNLSIKWWLVIDIVSELRFTCFGVC